MNKNFKFTVVDNVTRRARQVTAIAKTQKAAQTYINEAYKGCSSCFLCIEA